MLDGIMWFIGGILGSFGNVYSALSNPSAWLDFSNPEAVLRLIYYGTSKELFFALLTLFLIVTAIGLIRRPVLWACVRGLEGFANFTGRTVAWVGLIMVLQQIIIVFLQRIFRVSEIQLAPFGYGFAMDLSWWSEELKLYNAMIVALCVSYTFVQGDHVRVDLFYARVGYHSKRMIDMLGSIVFMVPVVVLTWLYGWFFFWRIMIVPNTSASDSLDKLLMKARAFRWNVETIGFSPNGFNGYFLFKVLILSFVALSLLQAIAFFYRNLLEYLEGPESEGKYLDKDVIKQGPSAPADV